jgi:hypothetical protein
MRVPGSTRGQGFLPVTCPRAKTATNTRARRVGYPHPPVELPPLVAKWGGKESNYFSGRGGFVPLSVVPSFDPRDVGGSSANRKAC